MKSRLSSPRSRFAKAENRVRAFELQCRDGSGWKAIFQGTTIGEAFQRKFEPVTSSAFRLNITDSTDGPTIWEIELK